MPRDLFKDAAPAEPGGKKNLLADYEDKQGVTVDPSKPKNLLAEPAKPAYQDYPARNAGISGLIGEVGEAVSDLPKHMLGSAARAYQGTEPYTADDSQGISDYLIKLSEEQAAARRREPDSEERVPFFGTRGEVSGDTGSSLGFSAANMAVGGVAGVGTALATGNPIAGYVAGAGASGTAAYRMAANQFLRDTIEAEDALNREEGGPGLSNEEKVKRQGELNELATEYGLYEAIPEAASNVAGLKILTTPLKKMLGKKAATRVMAKLGAFYGQELATETITGMGQQRVEAELDPATKARQFDDIDAWAETFKEIAPQTILLSTIMGGTAAGIAKGHQKYIGDPQKAQAYKNAATRPDQLQLLPDKELDRLIEQGQEVSGRRKKDVELRVAISALEKEKLRRGGAEFDINGNLIPEAEAIPLTAEGIQVEEEGFTDEVSMGQGPEPVPQEVPDLQAEPMLGEAQGIDVALERPITSELAGRFQQRIQEYRQRKAEEQIQSEIVPRETEGERLARENNALIEQQRETADAEAVAKAREDEEMAAEREQAILPTAQVAELTQEEVDAGVVDEVRPQSGEPYRSEKSAANMAKIRKLDNYVPVEKDGGWVLQRKRGAAEQLPDLTAEAAAVEVKETKGVPETPKPAPAPKRVPGGSQLRDALKGAGVTDEIQQKIDEDFPYFRRQAGDVISDAELKEFMPSKEEFIQNLLDGKIPKALQRQAGDTDETAAKEPEPFVGPPREVPAFLERKVGDLFPPKNGLPDGPVVESQAPIKKTGKSEKSGKTAPVEPKTGKNDVSQEPAPPAPPAPVTTTKDRKAALKAAGYRTSGSAAEVAQRHADMEEARELFKDYTSQEQIREDIKAGKLDAATVARLANAATYRNFKNSETDEIETRALGGGAPVRVLITRLRAMGLPIEYEKVYTGVEGEESDRLYVLAKKGNPAMAGDEIIEGRRTLEEEREYQGLSAKDKALRDGKDIEQAEDARDAALAKTYDYTRLQPKPAAPTPAAEAPTNKPPQKEARRSVINLLKAGELQAAYELAKEKGTPLRFTTAPNDGVAAVAYAQDEDGMPYGREAFSGQTQAGSWIVVDVVSGMSMSGPYEGNSRGKAVEATKTRSEWQKPWQRVQEMFKTAGKKTQYELETQFVAQWGGEPPPPPPVKPKPEATATGPGFKPYIVKTPKSNHFDRRKTKMVDAVEGGGEVDTNAEILYASSEHRIGVLNALGECFNAS